MEHEMSNVVRLATVRALAAAGDARRLRVAALLSESDVADAVGVDQSTVHRWESGERRPSGVHALRYLELLERLAEGARDAAS